MKKPEEVPEESLRIMNPLPEEIPLQGEDGSRAGKTRVCLFTSLQKRRGVPWKAFVPPVTGA